MQHILLEPWFIGISVKSFLVTFFCIIALFPLSSKLGLIDIPGGRKKHGCSVPLIGGVAIFISFTIVMFYLNSYQLVNDFVLAYWCASFLLVCVCVVDDKKPLSPKIRFGAQIVSISIIVFFGDTIILSLGKMFGFGNFSLQYMAIPFTFFAVIGVVNAVNMTDGLDGLTGSVSFIESVMLLILSIKANLIYESGILLVLIGSLVAFLVFNFPNVIAKKYKIFLGDSGSMFIGFTLAWVCIRLTQGEYGYPPVLMLWVMALPIMDTIYLIVNRKIRGVSPLKSDRRHMHHILQLYFSKRQTVFVILFFSCLVGFIGLSLYWSGASELLLFMVYIILFISYFCISHLLRKKIVENRKLFSLLIRN